MGCSIGHGSFEEVYEVGQHLGAGSFGCVFEVAKRGTSEDRPKAVKVIRRGEEKLIIPNQEAQGPVKVQPHHISEMQIWQKVSQCQGCVKLMETFEGGQFSYAVMERCGPSLIDSFKEVMCWDEDELAHLFRGMLLPLVFLHGRRIVHRDVKPDNFLFASSADRRSVKLCDFGTAAFIPKVPGFLRGRFGTAPYMSPEMAKGTGHSFGTDVWSTAASMYMMLFGEFVYMPAEIHNVKAVRACIIHDYPRPKFRRRKGISDMPDMPVPEDAIAFVAKLLQRSPVKRYTAKEASHLKFVSGLDARKLESK